MIFDNFSNPYILAKWLWDKWTICKFKALSSSVIWVISFYSRDTIVTEFIFSPLFTFIVVPFHIIASFNYFSGYYCGTKSSTIVGFIGSTCYSSFFSWSSISLCVYFSFDREMMVCIVSSENTYWYPNYLAVALILTAIIMHSSDVKSISTSY